MTNSTVSGNIGRRDGGGIRISDSNVSLANSTVSENISARDGGGIGASFSNVSLTNSTVSENSSARDGGGIGFNDSRILLVNSTVAVNSASEVGGGISFRNDEFFQAERLRLHNSIVTGNTDNGTAPDVEAVGVVVNDQFVENSLIGDTTGSGITATSGTGNILNQVALLGPLADNGGPTLTHALLPGSPAIDAGSNALAVDENGNSLSVDQRGEARIESSTVDIGAFESEGAFLLGDVNLDGGVDFLDISPFISLLAGSSFQDEADTNRDGEINFLDISPFISLLSSGGASTAASQAIGVVPPFSAAVTHSESVTSVALPVEGPTMTDKSLAKTVAALPAPASSTGAQSIPRLQASPALASDSTILPVVEVSEPPVVQTNNPPAVDRQVARATSVDTYVAPVESAKGNEGFSRDRDASPQPPKSEGLLVDRRLLKGSQERIGFSNEPRDVYPTTNVSTERSFFTAAEFFDAHPELLDEVFNFELE